MTMKYLYCPKCDILRPKTLLMGDRCEACRDEGVVFDVPRSAYGRAMYLVSGVAIGLIVLFLAHRDYDASFAAFLSGINETLFIALLFGLIILAFVLSFLDLGRTGKEACRIAEERRERIHD
jgi:hypothetical protein